MAQAATNPTPDPATASSGRAATANGNGVTIRKAGVADVPAMHAIINDAAEFGLMLHKSLAVLYENVREFHVAEAAGEPAQDAAPRGDVASGGDVAFGGEVVGVCGLSIIWADLAEVASLAVRPDRRGLGLGRRLVEACLAEARAMRVRKAMTLTYERAFFEKLGFAVVDRQELPMKVWSECVACPKNQACDEIAMVRLFEDVPVLNAPRPTVPAPDQYIVPTVRKTRG